MHENLSHPGNTPRRQMAPKPKANSGVGWSQPPVENQPGPPAAGRHSSNSLRKQHRIIHLFCLFAQYNFFVDIREPFSSIPPSLVLLSNVNPWDRSSTPEPRGCQLGEADEPWAGETQELPHGSPGHGEQGTRGCVPPCPPAASRPLLSDALASRGSLPGRHSALHAGSPSVLPATGPVLMSQLLDKNLGPNQRASRTA